MFCPNCGGYLQETQLIKTNVKKTFDTIVEYDARCTLCGEEIGRMSWGKLTLSPSLQAKKMRNAAQKRDFPPLERNVNSPNRSDEAPYAEIFAGKNAPVGGETSSKYVQRPPFPPPSYYVCPHCGRRLPEDKDHIPFRTDDLI